MGFAYRNFTDINIILTWNRDQKRNIANLVLAENIVAQVVDGRTLWNICYEKGGLGLVLLFAVLNLDEVINLGVGDALSEFWREGKVASEGWLWLPIYATYPHRLLGAYSRSSSWNCGAGVCFTQSSRVFADGLTSNSSR
jgi:hypothetical protein